MRFKRIFLCAVMAGCLSVPVSAEPLPTVELISVMDAVKPAIPKETGYAVVNLNIRSFSCTQCLDQAIPVNGHNRPVGR